MTEALTITRKIHFRTGRRSCKEIRQGAPVVVPTGRVPRISKLMALALKFEQMVHDGEVKSFAEIARVGFVSRARLSQITSLLNLAPSIQEALLFLPRTENGMDPITEHSIRPIAAQPDWGRQRGMWCDLSMKKPN